MNYGGERVFGHVFRAVSTTNHPSEGYKWDSGTQATRWAHPASPDFLETYRITKNTKKHRRVIIS